MSYELWRTKDGREVHIGSMSDLHLLHTIRAIEDGRIFPDVRVCSTFPLNSYWTPNPEKDKWLTVLKAEAIRRDLDWTIPPTKRVKLLDYAAERLLAKGGQIDVIVEAWRKAFRSTLGFDEPELEVSTKTGEPTYLHWQTGEGVGTPLSQ